MAADHAKQLARKCGDVRVQDESKYIKSYARILQTMQKGMDTKGFATGEDGQHPNRLYVLSQCWDGLSKDNCSACFSYISSKLFSCFPSTSGRLFIDGCFMRFDNYSFFQESTSDSFKIRNCSSVIGRSEQYTRSTNQLINNLVEIAPKNKGHADEEVALDTSSVYGIASCWKTLNREQCTECLMEAGAAVSKCLPAAHGRAFYTGCFLRYSSSPVSYKYRSLPKRDTVVLYFAYTLGGFGVCIFAVLIGISAGKRLYKRQRNAKDETHHQGLATQSLAMISLRFKFSTLQKATDDFSEARKIGQGGYGEVFKGSLPGGREIAVKRLFGTGKYQTELVCNEVDIICQAQHRNLVRLLGCCFTTESLLVYEFLANGSLDHTLFDPEKKKELDWKKRLGIIKGIAEGLEFLHKDAQVQIVHRDIKASNILLDTKYRPKIADFGLATFQSKDQIFSNTPIAGTLGYMAPEYLSHGRLTEKVDVYSYGVLVLEIVSGVQNNKYDSENTLGTLVATCKSLSLSLINK
ncbi:cysteine-rich receptor-like protein kinase 46 [Diospyros lotus]|uniref:cysteine-rich receptor-like protein kinase 46 n=1 Tax=Diospyros lotus TaxID=55363 RepID=UPI002255850F|nr:cysteine-rich receptor-like protein kinase 46 [Diospyros lotus]